MEIEVPRKGMFLLSSLSATLPAIIFLAALTFRPSGKLLSRLILSTVTTYD